MLQNKNAISINFFLSLKNNKNICEKIDLLRHIKLTIAHKNWIFSKQEFCHVSFLQHTVQYHSYFLDLISLSGFFSGLFLASDHFLGSGIVTHCVTLVRASIIRLIYNSDTALLEEISKRWRVVGNAEPELTGPRFELTPPYEKLSRYG